VHSPALAAVGNKHTTAHAQVPVRLRSHALSCVSDDLRTAITENKLVTGQSSVHTQRTGTQFGCLGVTVNVSA